MKTYQIIIDGTICAWGYSKQYVRNILDRNQGKHVDVRISSYGGDLAHGLDIRQQFIDHGDVTCYITGFVASAATIIAMGAKRVCMSKYAMFLVHKCSNFIDAWGNYNADQMQKLIEELEKNKQENDRIDVVIAQLYSQKTGKSISELLSLLKEETWLTAEQAKEWGFIDEITEDGEKLNFTDEVRQKLNAYGLPASGLAQEPKSKFRQAIDSIRQIFNSLDDEAEPDAPQAEAPATATEEPEPEAAAQNAEEKSQPIMNETKSYAAVNAALAVESLEADADGRVTLTAEQMQALNSHIADQDKKIEDMKNLPAAESKGCLDDTGDAEMSAEEMYKLSNEFLG